MKMSQFAAVSSALASVGPSPIGNRTDPYYSDVRYSPARVDGKKKRPSVINQTREQLRNLRRQGKVLCVPCGKGYVREQGVVIRHDMAKRGFPGCEALGHGCSEECAGADLKNTLDNFHTW